MSAAPATPQQTAYMQAAAIADEVLRDGLPLIGFDTYDDLMIFRFGGSRLQTIHMPAGPEQTAAMLIDAFRRFPP
jgi:hypothetical protein